MSDSKSCFVIAPIGEADSETRKRSDQVLKHIIRPAVETCGYSAERADEIDRPGLITSQVIQRVVSDPLVIADLTERNPNVFYELAIRHAIRKPLVQIIKKGERIPFDVANQRTVQVDHHDLDSVDTAKNEIVKQIKALEKDPGELETPISVSLDLQLLRQSEDPEERSLAEIVGGLADVRSAITKVEEQLGTSEEEGVLEQIQESLRMLPTHVAQKLDRGPSSAHEGRRLHPMLIHKLVRTSQRHGTDPIGLLILASVFREDFPWVYEIGVEAFRKAQRGPTKAAIRAIKEFRDVIELTIEGPWFSDLVGDKRVLMLRDELPFLLEDLLGFWISKEASGKPKPT